MNQLKRILAGAICCALCFATTAQASVPPWTSVNGVFYNDKGEVIKGALSKGIDVSKYQGAIDWSKIKDSDIEFAIIRCGVGEDLKVQDDTYFAQNVKGCEQYQIPYGIYLYSFATDKAMAQDEAKHVLRLIHETNANPKLPIYLDIEDKTQKDLPAGILGDIAETFCNTMIEAGYKAGVYSNLSFWNNKLTDNRFSQWDRWVAQYNSVCDYKDVYSIWQYTDKGQVNGIAGNVDINILFTNDCNIRGHIYSEGRVTKKASGTQAGILTYQCKVCGSSKTDTIPQIKSVTLNKSNYTYNGKANKPSVIVKDSKGKVIASSNYTITYSGNTKPGRATAKITFKGNYTGRVSKTFLIKPAKVKQPKAVNQKGRKVKVSWKKAVGISGYEIQYAKNKSFTKGRKIINAKSSAKTYTIKKLKKKQTYYIRVRAYKTISGKKVYGTWSNKKSIKVTK